MRYFSDVTKQLYESEKECLEAEKARKKEQKQKEEKELQLSRERKAAAERVEAKHKAMIDARNEYKQELSDFCEKYGYYHMSVKGDTISDWFSNFWDSWY